MGHFDVPARGEPSAGPSLEVQPGSHAPPIRTPDQRLRVFVSSTLAELAPERQAVREAIVRLRLTPVLFELGARPYPPRALYRAYLAQSDVFVGIYWQRYGWVATGEEVSGLEDEYGLAGDKPRLIYVKAPAAEREERLTALLQRIQTDDRASYRHFATPEELRELLENDLAVLLTERFARAEAPAPSEGAPPRVANLPVPRSSLVDREREAALARELLTREDVGLLTLTGPGGSGKTRLALHVAHELEDQFPDRVAWVPLASLRDPGLVASAIAGALGVREANREPLPETLKAALHERHLLLLLDNFEQVIGAAPLVAELLGACPRLKVLATSRAPLHLTGERELSVPPLALPDRRQLPEVERLSQYAAVTLFIQRARATRPDFAVTNDNALAVAEICARLDGLPLAIELAAARVKVLPPGALLARLERRLRLLTGGARDLPDRQRALRDTIGWSYDLLQPEEQALFRRLGVFAGGGTLEAIEAVCNAEGELGPDVLDGIAALVDQSLLREGEVAGSEPRFAMLETVREYALERLEERGEGADVRRAHAAFFLALAEPQELPLNNTSREALLERLETEHDNLRAALAWSKAEADGADLQARLAGSLAWFWNLRGHVTEGRARIEEALARLFPSERTATRPGAPVGGSAGLDSG